MRTCQTVGLWARSSLSRRRGPRHDGLMAAAALQQSESQRLAANDFETLKGAIEVRLRQLSVSSALPAP